MGGRLPAAGCRLKSALVFRNDIAVLFEPEPRQWGLRGDPLLWRDMRSRCAAVDIPADEEKLQSVVQDLFTELTGHSLWEEEFFHVPAYESHGMSSGKISPQFWRESALPLLKRRLATHNRPHRLFWRLRGKRTVPA